MKSLAFALTLAASVLPAHAEAGRAWLGMNDEELKSYAEIVQGLEIDPDAVFGKSPDPGKSQLRVRTYPKSDQELLIVESTASDKNSHANRELIRSIQLKRVAKDGSVNVVWEIRREKPVAKAAPTKRTFWIEANEVTPVAPNPGPMDFPESKFLRPMSRLEGFGNGCETS